MFSSSPLTWNFGGGYATGPNYFSTSSSHPYQQQAYTTDRLRVVYTNDTHEHKLFGMVTAFKQANAQGQQFHEDVLNVAAGDWNISTEPNELEFNVGVHNQMGIQYSTLGNHEFDSGSPPLSQALSKANFTTIASNLHIPKSSQLYQRWLDRKLATGPKIYTSSSGNRYGIVGLTVPHLWQYLNPDAKMEGVASLNLKQSIQRIQGDVDKLQAAGVNKIILISHCGFPADQEIAQKTHGIDIIVGGHSHTELKGVQQNRNYVTSASGEPVMIVQTGKDAHALGVLDVAWDPWGRVTPLQNQLYDPKSFPDDPAAVALANYYLGPEKILGYMGQDVANENAVSKTENGVANKVVDAIRKATGADIALFRGTELRNDIFKGPFSQRDLKILLPFRDNIVKFKMTGAQIMEALNESARCLKLDEHHPGIVHGAGLKYVVDKQRGKTIKAEIFNAKTKTWEPLKLDAFYTVAMDSFVAKNKKEYPVFKTVPIIEQFPFTARDLFGQYIQSHRGAPLYFPVDGRLKIVDNAPT